MPVINADPLAALPHANPFRFVSQVTELQPASNIAGVWVVKGNEDFLKGHFPGNPIMPGVLIIEALAQLSGLLAASVAPQGSQPFVGDGRLAHADVRFMKEARPPIAIQLRSSLARSVGGLHQFDAEAHADDELSARGTLTLALETRPV